MKAVNAPDPAKAEQDATLSRLLRFFAFGGLVAYVPSVWLSVVEGLWVLVAVDTLAYLVVIAAAFMPSMRFGFKLSVVVAVSMGVGVAVLVQTGPFGAGYIWLLAAMVLSALFGRSAAPVAVISLSTGIMLAWGVAVALGAPGFGSSPVSVAIIGSNLLIIGIALTMVIRRLMSRLESSLAERERIGIALERELEETRRVGMELERAVDFKEMLLRELHHRVKNNMQVVLSIIGLAHEGDPDPVATAGRRVRALALVNELVLSRTDSAAVDAGELMKALAGRACENRFPAAPAVRTAEHAVVGLDPQSAGLAAVLASDMLAAMVAVHRGIDMTLRGDGGRGLAVDLRFPPGVRVPAGVMESAIERSLVGALRPELDLVPLPGDGGEGPGVRLLVRQ